MKKYKILYIDDEYINLELLEINLKDKYHVLLAENGMTGLKLLDEHPDVIVVISDMRMPVMNGIEFIKKVKENYPNIHCFILTGYDITDEIAEALEEGLILDCLSKPFEMKNIEKLIESIIN